MDRVNSKFSLGFLAFVILVGVPISARALDQDELTSSLPPTAVFLDAETMRGGKSVESTQGLILGIPSQTISESAWVKIKKSSTPADQPLPEGWQMEFGPIVYDVRVKRPEVLSRPLFLSLPVDEDTRGMKRIAFWDRNRKEWRLLPSSIDQKNNRIRSATLFPYSIVAVLRNPDRLDAPVPLNRDLEPALDAKSAIAIDDQTGSVLYEKNGDAEVPIASLTKIMTALVFFDHFPGWKKELTYQSSDDRIGARLQISPGETLTVKDAFYVTLVGSANNTAIILARSTGLSLDDFVAEMNAKARELGLTQTTFVDPSGIEVGNVSTAHEYAKLAQAAFKDFRLLQGTTLPSYSFETLNLKRPHRIKNTNKLIGSELRITGAKTGYLDEARYCNFLKVKNADGNEILVVILGSPSSQDRFQESRELADWAFEHYAWQ